MRVSLATALLTALAVLLLPPAALAQPAAAPVKDCGNGGTYTKYVYARVVNVTTRGTSCKEAKRWIRAYYRHPGKGNCIDWAEGLTNRRCFFQGFNVTNTPKRKPTYYDVRATGGVHVTIGNVIRFQLKAIS